MRFDTRYGLDSALILLMICAAFFLVFELGYRFGRRHASRARAESPDLIQQGLLTLLALLLAFGVSMAESRFVERKAIEIDETNAIGTSYLRTFILPEPYHRKLASLLEDYLDARIEFYQLGFGDEKTTAANRDKTASLQARFWSEAAEFGRRNPTIIASLLLNPLNQAIDLQAKQDFAIEHRVPRSIIYLLLLASALVVSLVGYGHGLSGSRRLVFSGMITIVIVATLFVTVDLDRPQRGWIRLNSQPLLRLRESLKRASP